MSLLEQLVRFVLGESGSAIVYPPPGTAPFALVSFEALLLLCLLVRLVRFGKSPAPGGPPRRPARAFFGNVLTVVAFFALWELSLAAYIDMRIASDPQYRTMQPHPLLLWSFRPHAEYFDRDDNVIRINSAGLRDRELPCRKEKGEYRILTVGSSTTFGHGIPLEDSYPRQLEELLRARFPGRKLTVINAGMPGYTIQQGFFMLQEVGLKYDPDLVIVYGLHDFFDDIMLSSAPERYYLARLGSGAPAQLFHLQVALSRLDSYSTLRGEIARFHAIRTGGLTSTSIDFAKCARCNREERRFYAQRFIDLLAGRRIDALFIDMPAETLEEIALDRSSDVRIEFLQLGLDRLHEEPRYVLGVSDHHLNRKGNRVLAESLFRWMTRSGFLQ